MNLSDGIKYKISSKIVKIYSNNIWNDKRWLNQQQFLSRFLYVRIILVLKLYKIEWW